VLETIGNPLWVVANETLYDLCRRNASHRAIPDVVAKLVLIGRSYAAPIERGAGGAHLDIVYREAAIKLSKSGIDDKLSKLGHSACPTSDAALRIHVLVMECLPPKNGRPKCRRSVASKYLHFHRPEQFVLFDNRAVSAASKFVRAESKGAPTVDHDRQYFRHAVKCEAIKAEIGQRIGIALNNRQIDELLLAIADREW
jgi:hypothetical protein